MTYLRVKLSAQPPTLARSNTSAEEYVWLAGGSSASIATTPVWILEGASMNVEMDTRGDFEPVEMKNILQEDLITMSIPKKMAADVVTKTEGVATTTSKPAIANVLTLTTQNDDDDLALVMYAVLATVAVLLVVAGVLVLVWFLCRRFRSVNIFITKLSKMRGKRASRVIVITTRVQPDRISGPPVSKMSEKKDQE